LTGGDPVRLGLVASFNRPGGNLTGINVLAYLLIKKRLELLHELVPSAPVIAVLQNPSNPDSETRLRDVRAAAEAIRQQIHVLLASTAGEIDSAFATLAERRFGALLSPAIRSFTTNGASRLLRWRRVTRCRHASSSAP
jgi:putative ABC transport system substrate-binding protein